MTIRLASTAEDLKQILQLQAQNHYEALPGGRRHPGGFVTVRHELGLLTRMNEAIGQVIAEENGAVAGYALVMPESFKTFLPVLAPMFEAFQTLRYKGRPLPDYRYYVMGQICIGEAHRGSGLFQRLYEAHRHFYAGRFDLCLTEVSSSNARSMRAHEKVGFQTIHTFSDETDEWNILLWDWQ